MSLKGWCSAAGGERPNGWNLARVEYQTWMSTQRRLDEREEHSHGHKSAWEEQGRPEGPGLQGARPASPLKLATKLLPVLQRSPLAQARSSFPPTPQREPLRMSPRLTKRDVARSVSWDMVFSRVLLHREELGSRCGRRVPGCGGDVSDQLPPAHGRQGEPGRVA